MSEIFSDYEPVGSYQIMIKGNGEVYLADRNTPIYDQLVEDRKSKSAGDGFIQAMLDSYLSLKGEAGVLRRSWNKDKDFIYEYQVNELKSRRRYDYDYHRDFKREYGRKVYKSVVDWKV